MDREAIAAAISPIIVRNTPSVGRTIPEIAGAIADAIIALQSSEGEGLARDKYGETAIDRLRDHAENGTMEPQFRADLRAVLATLSPAEPSPLRREGEGLRPEVLAFAQLMERQLRANDHKPGWKDDSPRALCDRITDEHSELADALIFGIQNGLAHRATFEGTASEAAYKAKMADTIDRVGTEAADVANFAMMVADVCGALATLSPAEPSPLRREGEDS